ncbi:MAG: outer membrane protein assembly factor BamA [Deltaproteobacteria bacterium]|nr:outer membrane protein assembly factor BamA [Deltaproteobacteria bacterium]
MQKYFFLMILFFALAAEAKSATVAAVRIEGLHRISEDVVRDMIPFQVGDPFDTARVDTAVDFLRRWGAFDTLQVRIDQEPQGVVVTFHLEEATIVSEIDIVGNYPYIENRIRKHLTLTMGDVTTPEVLQEQIELIQRFYANEGYINTRVTSREVSRPDVGGVDVTFVIERGEVLRIRSIDIRGTQAFIKGRIGSAINPLRPYAERRLKAALRKLTDYYHHHGYPLAKLRIAETKIDYERRRVDLVIDAHEGPHVVIRFKGNRHVRDRTLKKAITILREGSVDTEEVETSRRAVRETIVSRGFPFATVEVERTVLPDKTIEITFVIDEGRPTGIKHIQFQGNRVTKKKKLKAVMENHEAKTGSPSRYLPEEMSRDTEAITKVLHQNGFLSGHVGEWQITPTRDGFANNITIPIEEGPRTLVDQVHFSGNASASDKQLLKVLQLTPGAAYNPDGLEEDRNRLLVYYADHGHPYAEVKQIVTLQEETHAALLRYDIEEGALVHIGRIVIVGDVETSQRAIKKAMEIHEGERFSYHDILESELAIRRLGPFTAVKIETIGLAEKESIVHLRVKIDEQRPFLVDMEFGYSTDNQYSGSLKFTNLNAFGWAKRNTLSILAGRETARLDLGWHDPRFFGSSFQWLENNWIEYKQEPAFTLLQLGAATGFIRQYRRLSYLFRVELDRNHFLEGSAAAAAAQSLRDNTIVKTTLSGSYDSRDSFSDPTRGFLVTVGGDFFNEISGNEANFIKPFTMGEVNYSPLRLVTLASSLRFHRIENFGKNVSVPTNELLFLGGDDTVRGFSEDSIGPLDVNGEPLGGRLRWIANEELRFRVTRHFQVAGFYDIGQLTDHFSDLSLNEARHSTGFGIRYMTPVGPIRADYGFKLDRRPGESSNRFHLTFGYFF